MQEPAQAKPGPQFLPSRRPKFFPRAMDDPSAITPEQFATTLENMAAAWEKIPENQRLKKSEEKLFWDNIPEAKAAIAQIIDRWHTGQSSHYDATQLAQQYSNDETGQAKLWKDVLAIRNDPFVQAGELKLRLVKYTASDEGE
eukprot:TRINITY_DN46044_c0_g1_i1.p2 TRINITY_DN46044_c0_g1~~TRINITY_DN46044_c0_g1_i1.p2  ORF type:complete len:143 (-),score=32.34 TRINITY_DN46044_c0_g1_i1:94-522(-)